MALSKPMTCLRRTHDALNFLDRGNQALHHDENINNSVNERHLGDLSAVLATFGIIQNLSLALHKHVYQSIKRLTAENLHRLLYCLDGWFRGQEDMMTTGTVSARSLFRH